MQRKKKRGINAEEELTVKAPDVDTDAPEPDKGKKEKQGRTVFSTIIRPLAVLLAFESFFLVGTLLLSGITDQLDENAREILQQQVEQRSHYWQTEMLNTWSDLTILADSINTVAQAQLDNGTLTLDTMNEINDGTNALLAQASEDVIDELYAKKASGIFVILNTGTLPQSERGMEQLTCPGLYLTNDSPSTSPTHYKGDLSVERASSNLVSAMGISLSTDWEPTFSFSKRADAAMYDALYRPFTAAAQAKAGSDASDYGYWCATYSGTHSVMSYSIPLLLKDGTVYGVVGIILNSNDVLSSLPTNDLYEGSQGSYVLGIQQGDGFTPVLINGPVSSVISVGTYLENGLEAALAESGTDYYAATTTLSLYDRTSPFADQQWTLVGLVLKSNLYSFSREMIRLLALAALCTLLIGALGSVYISRRLSYPIAQLARAVESASLEAGDVPELPKTDILEIDQFAAAITKLSHDTLDTASKFLSIMELASVELGGFRVRKDENTLFVTRNLFGMFGRPDLDEQTMSKGRFTRTMRRLHAGLQHTQSSDGSLLYAVPQPEGSMRYLRLETAWDGDICVGLVEDVTQTTKERMRIEHERDYDLLTGLYNRRAFVREAQELFDQPHAMGVAAVMMIDLDGLKSVNDSFGHEYGDTYIRLAAGCIANTGALCSRVSGDEFYLLFYGHFGKESILQAVARLRESLSATHMDLPNGNNMPLRASGGIAWYPDDGTNLIELMRLADFAMYQIKNNGKGAVGEFSIEAYTEAQRLMELRQEFQLFLAEERVTYFFQPIVDAHTGDIHAYEALMRTVNMPTLRSPQDVIDLARMENKLGEIERLTWFKASEAYELLLQRGQVNENALMFLNSIANECMSGELFAEYYKRYAEVRSHIVIEITEQEGLDLNATTLKRTRPGSTGLLALDDYGSGYNSEKNLLALAPNYIKIDMEIVRDIDKDQDKRQLVANTVQYAHSHGMKVIAEGLETPEEITTVVTLGVDLLQGYYLARPAAVPDAPSPQSVELLKQLCEQSDRQAYI